MYYKNKPCPRCKGKKINANIVTENNEILENLIRLKKGEAISEWPSSFWMATICKFCKGQGKVAESFIKDPFTPFAEIRANMDIFVKEANVSEYLFRENGHARYHFDDQEEYLDLPAFISKCNVLYTGIKLDPTILNWDLSALEDLFKKVEFFDIDNIKPLNKKGITKMLKKAGVPSIFIPDTFAHAGPDDMVSMLLPGVVMMSDCSMTVKY